MTTSSNNLDDQLDSMRRRAADLVRDLTLEQLTQRPRPDQWSVGECIAHLNATAAVVQSLMARAIARGKQEKKFGSGPFALGMKGRLLIWFAEPPPKIRIPAPRSIRPPARIDEPQKLLPAFLQAQDEWERLMKESAGLDLARIKIGSPASLFRSRLAAAWPWMMAHQRRHLLQAENVKRELGG